MRNPGIVTRHGMPLLALALAACSGPAPAPEQASGPRLTLGIHVNCPYGLIA
jgi:hypothetical protein